MRSSKGFTMTEIMISIVILAVLTGLAIPAYNRTIEQSRKNEAITNISIIHMGQKIYRLNNASFWDPGRDCLDASRTGTGTALMSNALNIDISATYYTGVCFSNVSATGYTVSLWRDGNVGGGDGRWNYVYVWDDTNKRLTDAWFTP